MAETKTPAGMPDEVVTHAYVRPVAVPGLAGPIALITLDNGLDYNRPNSFGPKGLAELDAALDAAYAIPGVAAVAVTGKPFILAAGADLSGMPYVTAREQALELGRLGHGVFGRLGDGPVPTFGFINGVALGGGLEVALNCTYRTVSQGAQAIGLPECFLGLVPGWGGAWLLPNLLGAEKALKVIIENPLAQNKMLDGRQAYELGIADAMFGSADFLEQSLAWAAGVLSGRVTVPRAVDRGEAWDAAVTAARAMVDARLHGAAPAPLRALDLVAAAKTATKAEGFAAEDEALADLVMSQQLRAGLYAFDLVQKRAKRPAGAPDKALARKVTKVGVVGAGLMASQMALLFARRLEVPVVMTDLDQGRLDKGVGYCHSEVDKLVTRKRMSLDTANKIKALISGSLTKDAFADADVVIEAVFEDMKVKQQVFAEVEAAVADTCVLLTNTSSLSVTEMGAQLSHPERLVGFHFFNPVAVMPLLEIVKAEHSDDPSLATAFALAKTLKKSAVLVKDAPAFVVNRLLTRFMGEVNAAIDAGAPIEVADRAVDPLGLPMSPMVLLGLVGPAVAMHTGETMHHAFPDRYRTSEGLRRIVEAGKTGVYLWENGQPVVDPEVAALMTPAAAGTPLAAEEVRTKAEDAVADEIRRMLDDGVVAGPQDIDLCMILGAGWPFHNGGITPYLDRTGVSERVTGKRFLPPGVATLP